MVNYTNRDYITSLSATDTTDGLKDGTDKIHATILRYLDLAARGNYVFSYDGANFQQTAGSSRTQFGFSGNISWVRDGQHFSASVAARELGADPDATHTRYDLFVITASNVSAIRQGTAGATPRGPDNLTDGDIPVALIEVAGGSGDNITTRKVQLFGYNKKENQLSIGDENSGAYREVGTISPVSGDIAITATVTNGNVDLNPNGTGDVKLGTLVIDGDQALTDGHVLTYSSSAGKAALAALPAAYSDSDAVSAIETEAGLNFSTSSSDAIIANTTQDKDIIFQVNDGGGGGASTEVMRIDGDVSRVGIGTATPAEKLSVSGNIRSSGDVIVGGDLDHNGSNVGFYGTAAASRQSVGNMGTTSVGTIPSADPTLLPGLEPGTHAYIGSLESEIGNLRTKLDALIDALQLYGLIT